LVIAKKNIRLAVQRNRIKRILRESFRLRQETLIGLDIVVLARRGLDDLDNQQLHQLFHQQWQRLEKKHAKQTKQEPGSD
ncbi:MAG: ribonuclease P protein component, partial [Pseudomonadota bacterium]|nr:ribonuclease P protein component [Pseudomonadota bacterium]